MRIFIATQKTPNEIALPESSLWHANLQMPLEEMGHELIPFSHPWLSIGYDRDPNDPAQEAEVKLGKQRFGEALLEQLKAEHKRRPIDLFFSYFSSAHIDGEIIREISRMGIPTVNWYCNASYQFHLIRDLAPAFDYCLVPEKFRLQDYREAGANPIYCQEAANPTVYKPYKVGVCYDISFVGQRYGTRPDFINRLYQDSLEVNVFGPGWQEAATEPLAISKLKQLTNWVRGRQRPPESIPPEQCGPPLSDLELVKLYSRSEISLGFSTVAQLPTDDSQPIKQVRLRDFEATMSGAFYMVEEVEELHEFFEPGKEIVTFQSPEDLSDKAGYYLLRPRLRRKIREAGLKRARQDHSWQNRFQMVFEEMGLVKESVRCAG